VGGKRRSPDETQGQVEDKKKARSRRANKKYTERQLTARDAEYIKERLKPGVSKGEAAQRAGLASIPSSPVVEKTVQVLIRKQLDLAAIDGTAVINELKRIGMVDLAACYNENNSLLPVSEMDEDTRRAISSIEIKELYEWVENEDDPDQSGRELVGYTTKVRTDKIKALELLSKHFGLLDGGGKKGGDRLNEILAAMNEGPVKRQ